MLGVFPQETSLPNGLPALLSTGQFVEGAVVGQSDEQPPRPLFVISTGKGNRRIQRC